MPTVAEIISVLDSFAPTATAAGWDNVGLLLGDRTAEVRRILTCLTLTPNVADEAVSTGCQLIVTHHPILFRGAKQITSDTPEGRTILTLTRAGIAVYSPHTAFDNCPGGINEQIASRLGLSNVRPLRLESSNEEYKLVVFVPDADLAKVSDAIFAAGSGVIGQYRECSFRLPGRGTFFGGEASNPTLGQKGRREDVSEWRLEAVCPKAKVETVVAALRRAHSYEEPAFDIYPLVAVTTKSGAGRLGDLDLPLAGLAERVKQELNCSRLQIVGDLKRSVKRLAIACGAAGEFLPDAIRAGADAFLTGEMRFHDYLTAQAAGIALVLPGHYATERFAVEEMARWAGQLVAGIVATASQSECDPVTWV